MKLNHLGEVISALRAVPDNLCGIAEKDLFLEMLDSLGGPDREDCRKSGE